MKKVAILFPNTNSTRFLGVREVAITTYKTKNEIEKKLIKNDKFVLPLTNMMVKYNIRKKEKHT